MKNNNVTFDLGRSIPELFNFVSDKNADCIAVTDEKNTISYRHLNDLSEIVAKNLFNSGVKKGEFIPLVFDRSIDMIVAIIAVLKTGAAYIPIDYQKTPFDRVNSIISDSNAGFIITSSEIQKKYFENKLDKKCLLFENLSSLHFNGTTLPLVFPEDTAYAIYTSGSTGEPKGCINRHNSIINLVNALYTVVYNEYPEKLNIGLIASFMFDASVQQIFAALLGGHNLVIVSDATKQDSRKLITYLNKQGIVISDGTPSFLRILNQNQLKVKNLSVRHFIIGGEAFRKDVVDDFYAKFVESQAKITNIYGVAECAVDTISFKMDRNTMNLSKNVPIGKALPNMQVFIINDKNECVEKGEHGQLCLAGIGVGNGYINRPQLTELKFVKLPQLSDGMLYKTGDLVKELEDGNIEFIERIDNQVKLHGYRIETDDIRTNILTFDPSIESANKVEKETCDFCLLDSSIPNVNIHSNKCNICSDFEKNVNNIVEYFQNIDCLKNLLSAQKSIKKSKYDCLVLFSGGKDSTYVLWRLVQMGYKPLAYTFDNYYISLSAKQNIQRVTKYLGVDLVVDSHPQMDNIFCNSLKLDSTVCTGCFKTLTTKSTAMAIEKGINVIVTGLSRGQIIATKLEPFINKGIVDINYIEKQLFVHRSLFHNAKDTFSQLLGVIVDSDELKKIQFIDFFRYDSISNELIKKELESLKIWERPSDTGFCSTNCLINDTGIYVHKSERGYHNYAKPLSWDIRLGVIPKNRGEEELRFKIDESTVKPILQRIGYKKPQDKPISDAVVCLKPNKNGEDILCAYVVANTEIDFKALKEYLTNKLNSYMIPSRFQQVEKFPLNVSGKIDTVALPIPDILGTEGKQSAMNCIEGKIYTIWQDVLESQQIGLDDNFRDIGGDSMNATIITVAVAEEFNLELEVDQFFKGDTSSIRHQSKFVEHQLATSLARNSLTKGLVLLKKADSTKKNLFLLHDVWGNTECYNDLLKNMNGDFNIYGLADFDHSLERKHSFNITKVAQEYMARILSVQNEGPYYLTGWSMGAILAYEIAVNLEKNGRIVEKLILLDSNCPKPSSWKKEFSLINATLEQVLINSSKGLNIENTIPDILMKIIPGRLRTDYVQLIDSLNFIHLILEQLLAYKPNSLTLSEIIFFKASNSEMVVNDSWESFSSRSSQKVTLTANHFSILKGEAVKKIADYLHAIS